MKLISDSTGRFQSRPFFEEGEIDNECSLIVIDYLQRKGKRSFSPPLITDDLTCMIEEYVEDLDLYADLESSGDAAIEGVTEFRLNKQPLVKIDKCLSEEAWRGNRLRTTLAHEFFHVRYHNVLWQLEWASQASSKAAKGAACHEAAILTPAKVDWLEWQAAYGSGAFLMPRATIVQEVQELLNKSAGNLSIIEAVSKRYLVSQDAARVRLEQLNLLPQARAASPSRS